MTRKKPEQDLVERGRKHKISESKRAILNHFGTQFYSVVPLGHVGKFYDAVVWWCIKHWGYRADLSVDLAGDELFTDIPPTLAAGSDDEEVDEDSEPSEEEIEMRNTYRTKLRQVRLIMSLRVLTKTNDFCISNSANTCDECLLTHLWCNPKSLWAKNSRAHSLPSLVVNQEKNLAKTVILLTT